MKDYVAKTLEEAIQIAAKDQGVSEKDLVYIVKEEKKGLFRKTATISVYEINDAAAFAENYLINGLKEIGITAKAKTVIKDSDIIFVTLDSEQNNLIIGKDGKNLQALIALTRLAVFQKFKKRYRVLIDINGYKENKYKKLIFLAKKAAREVLNSKGEIKLDPMPSDERRKIHNALSKFSHISSESVGEGKNRAIVIKYVD